MCLLGLYLLNHWFHFYHSFVTACNRYFRCNSQLHMDILLPFKWRQTIAYLYKLFLKSRVRAVNQGGRNFWGRETRENQTKSGNFFRGLQKLVFSRLIEFLNFLHFRSLALVKSFTHRLEFWYFSLIPIVENKIHLPTVLMVSLALLRYLKKMKCKFCIEIFNMCRINNEFNSTF